MSRLAIEIGGTFTDVMWHDDGGRLRTHKTPSTPDDPAAAVFTALEEIGLDPGAERLGAFVHGSTVATNAVLTRRGARAGLLVTRGFRDVLALQRQLRANVYDPFPRKPEPLVPGRRVREVAERLDHRGEVLEPLDEDRLLADVRELVEDQGVESLALCLLHAYRNPVHERRAAELIARAYPDLPVMASSDVLPVFREYERASATAICAYIVPRVRDYLEPARPALPRRLHAHVHHAVLRRRAAARGHRPAPDRAARVRPGGGGHGGAGRRSAPGRRPRDHARHGRDEHRRVPDRRRPRRAVLRARDRRAAARHPQPRHRQRGRGRPQPGLRRPRRDAAGRARQRGRRPGSGVLRARRRAAGAHRRARGARLAAAQGVPGRRDAARPGGGGPRAAHARRRAGGDRGRARAHRRGAHRPGGVAGVGAAGARPAGPRHLRLRRHGPDGGGHGRRGPARRAGGRPRAPGAVLGARAAAGRPQAHVRADAHPGAARRRRARGARCVRRPGGPGCGGAGGLRDRARGDPLRPHADHALPGAGVRAGRAGGARADLARLPRGGVPRRASGRLRRRGAGQRRGGGDAAGRGGGGARRRGSTRRPQAPRARTRPGRSRGRASGATAASSRARRWRPGRRWTGRRSSRSRPRRRSSRRAGGPWWRRTARWCWSGHDRARRRDVQRHHPRPARRGARDGREARALGLLDDHPRGRRLLDLADRRRRPDRRPGAHVPDPHELVRPGLAGVRRWGASSALDGMDVVDCPLANCSNVPVEALEADHPYMRVEEYAIRPHSAGEGRFRGGHGARRVYRILEPGVTFNTYSDRHRFAPWGLFGGEPGAKSRYTLERDGETLVLPSKTNFELRPGDRLVIETAGGGGYGDPRERDPDAVFRDVADGLLSEARAAEVHGVTAR